MNDFRSRLLEPCAELRDEKIAVDVGTVLDALVLFDTFIVQSVRLLEAPTLIAAFGADGLISLLESGRLRVQMQAATIAQTGQYGGKGGDVLPLGAYRFSTLQIGDREDYRAMCLREVDKTNVATGERERVKKSIVESLVEWPEMVGQAAVDQLHADLRANAPLIKSAIANSLRIDGIETRDVDFECRVEQVGESGFRVATNLDQIGLGDERRRHSLIERGLLALASVNQRIEEMQTHNSVSRASRVPPGETVTRRRKEGLSSSAACGTSEI